MVSVMTLGAQSWEPSSLSTGILAGFKSCRGCMAFLRIMFEGRVC